MKFIQVLENGTQKISRSLFCTNFRSDVMLCTVGISDVHHLRQIYHSHTIKLQVRHSPSSDPTQSMPPFCGLRKQT